MHFVTTSNEKNTGKESVDFCKGTVKTNVWPNSEEVKTSHINYIKGMVF
jgi:hypothetical protein